MKGPRALGAIVVVLAVVLSTAASASAATTGRASTSAGGVTYAGGSNQATFNFTNSPVGGTIDAGTQGTGDYYTAVIVCASFPGGDVAYFGARLTSGEESSTVDEPYVYWSVTAGGPGVGTVAGVPEQTETCYDGSNGSDVGGSIPIDSGTISVTVSNSTRCVVPRLVGATLNRAKRLLGAAHCTLGHVTTKRGHKTSPLTVVAQSPHAGTTRSTGFRVSVTIAHG